MDHVETTARGFLTRPGEGETHWFLGSRMRLLAGTADTEATFTLLEQSAPPGFAPPQHVHLDEHEAFFVVEGSMTVACGEDTWEVTAGDFVNLPRGVWHGFTVGDQGVRILHLTSPGRFEHMVRAVGEPANDQSFRPPSQAELERLAATVPGYGIMIDT